MRETGTSVHAILRAACRLSLLVAASTAAAQSPLDGSVAPPPIVEPPARVTWSEVTGQSGGVAARDRAGTVIRRVDGAFVRESRVKIEPGERDVVVRSPPRHGLGGTERHFRLKAEPCRRYYVNAQFRTASGTDWTPVVAKSEPIVGCRTAPRRF
jgi:hypothetical protein